MFQLSLGILDDLRRLDPGELHRFLWSKHLAYAESYEVDKRFGPSKLNPTRRVLFDKMCAYLRSRGMDPPREIRSVFEIGCSGGYLLRHLETEVFSSAAVLRGIDVDAHAVRSGASYLRALDSRVRLMEADMAGAAEILGGELFDVVLCCGVLMYADEAAADRLVRTMLSHARHVVGIICLAPPCSGDPCFEHSQMRSRDGTFVHNVHRMIHRAGGRIVDAVRVDRELSGSNSSYVIVAAPPAHA